LRVEAFGSAADFLKKGRIANGITAYRRLPHS
jgi:hypothetical protein